MKNNKSITMSYRSGYYEHSIAIIYGKKTFFVSCDFHEKMENVKLIAIRAIYNRTSALYRFFHKTAIVAHNGRQIEIRI